jgi:hypothetical protein
MLTGGKVRRGRDVNLNTRFDRMVDTMRVHDGYGVNTFESRHSKPAKRHASSSTIAGSDDPPLGPINLYNGPKPSTRLNQKPKGRTKGWEFLDEVDPQDWGLDGEDRVRFPKNEGLIMEMTCICSIHNPFRNGWPMCLASLKPIIRKDSQLGQIHHHSDSTFQTG